MIPLFGSDPIIGLLLCSGRWDEYYLFVAQHFPFPCKYDLNLAFFSWNRFPLTTCFSLIFPISPTPARPWAFCFPRIIFPRKTNSKEFDSFPCKPVQCVVTVKWNLLTKIMFIYKKFQWFIIFVIFLAVFILEGLSAIKWSWKRGLLLCSSSSLSHPGQCSISPFVFSKLRMI